jgi:CheY-like chemotaxis protein
MATPKMVRLPDPEIEIPSRDLLRVLVIDDDRDVRESLSARLRDCGYDVDAAEGLLTAREKLQSKHYQMLIVDHLLPGSVTGDHFVLACGDDLFPGARVVIITGLGIDTITNRAKLDQKGIEILAKGPELFPRLSQLTEAKLNQQTAEAARMIKESAEAPSAVSPTRAITEVQNILVHWLSTRKDPNKLGIYYGGKLYSPKMLINEIEHGTEVGEAHLDMFLDLVKASLGIAND